MKTIKQHWESLPNKKLGEWLMKQPLVIQYNLGTKCVTQWHALCAIYWKDTNYENVFRACSNMKSWQPLLDALPELREDEPVSVQPKDYTKSSTHSAMGSVHWFNTLLCRALHIGEFLKSKKPDDKTLKKWGEGLYDSSKELLEGFKYINNNQPIVQPQQDTRRAEVVQLVAAMTTGKEYDYFEIDRLARKAIAIQAEIDKQLKSE